MTKRAGRGLTVEFNGSAVGQLTAFGEVGSQRALIDASAYGDDWKDYVLGQQDGVEVNLVLAYDPAETAHTAIVTDFNSNPDAVNVWTVAHADASWEDDVSARTTQITRGGALDGLFQMSVTIKIVEPGVVGS